MLILFVILDGNIVVNSPLNIVITIITIVIVSMFIAAIVIYIAITGISVIVMNIFNSISACCVYSCLFLLVFVFHPAYSSYSHPCGSHCEGHYCFYCDKRCDYEDGESFL